MMTELQYARPMRRLGGVLLAALLTLSLTAPLSSPADAAEASPRPLPAEPGAYLLDRQTLGAIVADIDGDGEREVARFVPRTDAPGRMALQVLRLAADGSPHPLGEVGLRRGASVDEQFESFRPVDRDKMLELNADEPARFVIWHDGKRERLLAVTIGTDDLPVACCLTVWQVRLGGDGRLSLVLLANTSDNATSVRAVDMDGDGVDELFLTLQPRADGPNEVPIRVLRWRADGFTQLRTSIVAPPDWDVFVPGETDGRPGDEVLINSDRIDGGPGAVLYRFWVEDGQIAVESHAVPDRGQVAAMDGAGAPELVTVPTEIGLGAAIDWPAGRSPAVRSVNVGAGRILGTLGSGVQQRLLVERGDGRQALLDVRDRELRPHQAPAMTNAAREFAASSLPPYFGEFPGGVPDLGPAAVAGYSPAYVFGGRLITAAPDSSGSSALSVQAMAVLPGVVPIGVVGANGSSVVLFHQSRFDPSRRGGPLAPLSSGRLSVAPAAVTLAGQPDDASLPASFPELAEDPSDGSVTRLVSAQPQIGVELAAPTGSLVSIGVESSTVTASQLITASPQRLEVRPADEIAARGRFPLTIRLVTPAGRGYAGRWIVEVRPDPPALEVQAGETPLSFSVPVHGHTDPAVSVSIDGEQVEVSQAGDFSARVDASLFPRDVRVLATDPLGRVTQQVVSVVALFDYRQLPWVAIVVLLTVAAGGLLLLRVPRLRPEPERQPDDDARLEEID